MMICGLTHPIPTEFAERIYNDGKNVFIGKRCLCKAKNGNKFIIYESQGARAYTGWGDIEFIGKVKTRSITKLYGNNLMINKKELQEYVQNRSEMAVIKFSNFERFKTPIKPKRFITVAGKYIYEDEFKRISQNNGL